MSLNPEPHIYYLYELGKVIYPLHFSFLVLKMNITMRLPRVYVMKIKWEPCLAHSNHNVRIIYFHHNSKVSMEKFHLQTKRCKNVIIFVAYDITSQSKNEIIHSEYSTLFKSRTEKLQRGSLSFHAKTNWILSHPECDSASWKMFQK